MRTFYDALSEGLSPTLSWQRRKWQTFKLTGMAGTSETYLLPVLMSSMAACAKCPCPVQRLVPSGGQRRLHLFVSERRSFGNDFPPVPLTQT